MDFWAGKTPCWKMRDCASNICSRCQAYLDRSKPCWEIKDTLCDKMIGTKKSCDICKVFLKYGDSKSGEKNKLRREKTTKRIAR